MSITSLEFCLFCIITVILYFIVPKRFQWIILLISSSIFLLYDNLTINTILQALIVLIPSYFLGIMIEKNYDTKKAKISLIIGILIIIGQLFYLKYINLFLITANYFFNLFNVNYYLELVDRNSLIGISYFSLVMISYLVDIYRGTCKAQKNILKCALLMSYFPILVSGPFIRYDSTGKELYAEHKFNYDNMCKGLVRILWGLFKILAISQRLGYFVDTVYNDLVTYIGLYVVIAALFFTLQLFTNFSGSIDVIIGISEIIGIKLPENFNLPFFSRTMTEFWRNWHITLGAWLRDYIFYPLQKSNFMQNLKKRYTDKFGKKFGKKISMYLSMLVMWLLIGAWHGGAYTYIIGSGILQFIYIVMEETLSPVAERINNKLNLNTDSIQYRIYQRVRTFLLFSFSMIFFRATSLSHAIQIIKNIFVWNTQDILNIELLNNIGITINEYIFLFIALFILFLIACLTKNEDIREKIFKQNILLRWTIIYVLILLVIIFGCYGPSYDAVAFIYRDF